MKKLLVIAAFLWIAFGVVGLKLHQACVGREPNRLGWVDIGGYDSEGYLSWFTNIGTLFTVNHRHPLMCTVLSPVTAVGSTVAQKADNLETGKKAVIFCFALFGAGSFLLLWLVMSRMGTGKVSRVAAAVLWLSFAQTWILAGIAESFGPSQTILLGVLLMAVQGVVDWRLWTAMSAVSGAVTVTNGVKPLIAWILCGRGRDFIRGIGRRTVWLVLLSSCGAAVLLAGIMAVKWAYVDGIGAAEGFAVTLSEVTMCLPQDLTFGQRLWHAWNSFWCEPMLLHESVIGKSVVETPYRTVLPHLACAAVLVLCAWSAVRNFRLPVVRAALAMVAFDVLLHVVVGWGIVEGQIYCGHWFWIIPLLVSLLPRRCAYAIFALAVLAAVHNVIVLLP